MMLTNGRPSTPPYSQTTDDSDVDTAGETIIGNHGGLTGLHGKWKGQRPAVIRNNRKATESLIHPAYTKYVVCSLGIRSTRLGL